MPFYGELLSLVTVGWEVPAAVTARRSLGALWQATVYCKQVKGSEGMPLWSQQLSAVRLAQRHGEHGFHALAFRSLYKYL